MTPNPPKRIFDRPQALEQEELGSICFVRNYVEFRFDGPIIRSFVGPIIETDGNRLRFPEDGSRDALCDFIGRTLIEARETSSELTLRFDEGMIRVPLKADPGDPVEAAHFVPEIDGDLDIGKMWVWQ